MQVSRIAVSNQLSTSKNQKSPAFGDKLILATQRCGDVAATMKELANQTGILEKDALQMHLGKVTSELTCGEKYKDKLAAYFLSLTSDLKDRFGLRYEGDALEPMLAERRKALLSSTTDDSQLPVPAVQRFPIADFIPGWS